MTALIESMADDSYRSIQAVNISLLKELRHSPQRYLYRKTHPLVSAALTRGIAAHAATLEPDRFATGFVVWDRVTEAGASAPRRGKAWDEFSAMHAGKTIMTAAEYETASSIARAVRLDPIAAKYLDEGEPELSLMWQHSSGRACKGRIDWLTHLDGEPVVVGLKTAQDCRHFAFGSVAARLGYHLQWAFYHDGYVAVTGKTPRMVEIVVEASPPHGVVTYIIPDDILAQGRGEYETLLALLETCERDDYWPGPATTEHVLTLPSWVYGSDEDISDLGLED